MDDITICFGELSYMFMDEKMPLNGMLITVGCVCSMKYKRQPTKMGFSIALPESKLNVLLNQFK